MKRILLNFASYSDAALLVLAQGIHVALTGNPFFTTTSPDLTTFLSVITAYSNALAAAQNRGKDEVGAKNARKAELVALLADLALDIMKQADGNVEALISSGFPLNKSRQPQPPLGIVDIAKIEVGENSGELLVIIKPVPGARTYIYQYTQDPITANSVWTSQNSTLIKETITGLETGKKNWIRVVAYGINKQMTVCDPVLSKIVQ